MELLHSPSEYLFNLRTTSSSEAKRLWRKEIKEKWENQCAYCGSEENITLDHIVPQCKGGLDIKTNVVACCHSCNQSKGHEHWKLWYVQQDFYSEKRLDKIEEWMKPDPPVNLFSYRPRRNNAS
jgi:5-methylcytosine-specific restriction endonuclease McrA